MGKYVFECCCIRFAEKTWGTRREPVVAADSAREFHRVGYDDDIDAQWGLREKEERDRNEARKTRWSFRVWANG